MLPFVYCWWQPSYTTIGICRGSFTFYKLSLPIYLPSMDFLIRQKHLLCQNFIHKLSWLREFYKLNQIAKMSKGEKINALQFRQRSPTVVTSVVTQLWVLPPWRHTCWALNCTLCEYSSKQVGDLKKHMLIHSGERPFNCTQCNQAFKTPLELKQHILNHKERSLMCVTFATILLQKPRTSKHIR